MTSDSTPKPKPEPPAMVDPGDVTELRQAVREAEAAVAAARSPRVSKEEASAPVSAPPLPETVIGELHDRKPGPAPEKSWWRRAWDNIIHGTPTH